VIPAAKTAHPVSSARRVTSLIATEVKSSVLDARGTEKPASLALSVEAAEIAEGVTGSCLEYASKLFSEINIFYSEMQLFDQNKWL